ncbi:VOC family protein [Chryseobacterium caseinilyticum]|uniref:VOC family protein n=1 Tax=Chryseobacterium caseinilyticum TaxID=2771428 RepID=A0ABR8Z9X0_9FLAO|nr:VOC family protein [Chryseobacterium caseinilyticum]MBD8082008.1 VOC family protein [Chryseobacterium caseinilyticum]
MKFKQIWANFAVENIERTEKFYRHLGLERNGSPSESGPEMTSFKFGESDFVIHFFKKDQLEFAMNGKVADSENGNEIIFSISAESEDEVNLWAQKVLEAGGKIHKEAKRQEDGYYYCVFADPDGHKFNVLRVVKGM